MYIVTIINVTAATIFFAKTEGFPIQNHPRNLDPSCKMDLDFLVCFGKKYPSCSRIL